MNGNQGYPAASRKPLNVVCEELAASLRLPPFVVVRRSEHLERAESASAGMSIELVHFLDLVTREQAAALRPPDYSYLAYRAVVGRRYNYSLRVIRGSVTRNQQRRFVRKLRSVFNEIKLHGAPVAATNEWA